MICGRSKGRWPVDRKHSLQTHELLNKSQIAHFTNKWRAQVAAVVGGKDGDAQARAVERYADALAVCDCKVSGCRQKGRMKWCRYAKEGKAHNGLALAVGHARLVSAGWRARLLERSNERREVRGATRHNVACSAIDKSNGKGREG